MRTGILIVLILFSLTVVAQNKMKNAQRHGKWTVLYDNGKIDNTGRYRKGTPTGKWKYFSERGQLLKTETFRRRRIRTKLYHQNGKIYKEGYARIVSDDSLIHYYYYGPWKEYDSLGRLSATLTYKDGILISRTSASPATNENKEMLRELFSIDSSLNYFSDALQRFAVAGLANSEEYIRLQSLANMDARRQLERLSLLLDKFGYPGTTLAGENKNIAFSIISRAPLDYRLRYYSMIIDAANRAELDWNDVAFFVDKVRVAQKKPTVYGTQFVLENDKLKYYPVEEISTLNERRKKAGLPETDPAFYNETVTY
jgi:hypothetical protein